MSPVGHISLQEVLRVSIVSLSLLSPYWRLMTLLVTNESQRLIKPMETDETQRDYWRLISPLRSHQTLRDLWTLMTLM